MRKFVVIAAVLAVASAQASLATAAPKKRPVVVERSAAGTIIQPTRTIIHHADGTTTVYVTPRSYLDTGTEVSVGDRGFTDYIFPPGGDPGRSSVWYYGPDTSNAVGAFSPARPFYLPGYSPYSPF
ncbi:MAG: hypothetical protein WB760_32385 [Xanthobacteraceae bacterium]